MRNRFDDELYTLKVSLRDMAEICRDSITGCIKAMRENDTISAEKVQRQNEDIKRLERQVENICLKLLVQQSPVASDLRVISASLKMVSDLERIGSQASDIAEMVLQEKLSQEDREYLSVMGEETEKMVENAIHAYLSMNEALARKVIAYDDIVDDMFNQAKENIARDFGATDADIECALSLLMISKYFEKIADHTVNIAQWAIYAMTGVREGNTD